MAVGPLGLAEASSRRTTRWSWRRLARWRAAAYLECSAVTLGWW